MVTILAFCFHFQVCWLELLGQLKLCMALELQSEFSLIHFEGLGRFRKILNFSEKLEKILCPRDLETEMEIPKYWFPPTRSNSISLWQNPPKIASNFCMFNDN